MKRKLVLSLFCLIVLLLMKPVYALNVETHKDINVIITEGTFNGFSLDAYLKTTLGIQQGIKEKVYKNTEIGDWLKLGGEYEDIPYWYMPYLRSVNHFHNPLTEQGFSGTWGTGFLSGISSTQWALLPLNTQSPGGYYSWNDVREYYYKALTSIDRTSRAPYFAETFRGLGQLMHLIQDVSVPAHTRDDGHLFYNYEKWVAMPGNVDLSNIGIIPFNGSIQSIASFIETNQYNGTNPNIAVGNAIGLSEYTNANFFSEDTIFADSFPYPAWSSVMEYDEVVNINTGEQRTYLRKAGDGETIQHLATGKWFYKYLPSEYKRLGLKLDDNVYEDYARLLIPRAVGYSAVLIDYFFRGSIELTPPDRFLYSITAPGGSFNEIRVKARNVTPNGEEMPNGSIQLVVKYRLAQQDPFQSYPVPRDPESYIVVPEKNGVTAIPKDTPVELVFDLTTTPIPLWATDVSVQVVYRGVLGNEADAVAVGFKDISEPTPVEIINNMDYVCINGSYYVAGSPEALSLVDTNHNGIADEADIYPHGLSDIYILWSSLSSPRYASATDYQASFSTLAPGSYGRIFILTEYEHYLGRQQTLIHSNPQDQWGWSFGAGLSLKNGLKNQDEYINGVLTRFYPTFESWRGINAWTGVRYENPAVPYGTICTTEPPAGLTGPVGFGMP